MISQTTFDKFKNENFVFLTPSPKLMKKFFLKKNLYTAGKGFERQNVQFQIENFVKNLGSRCPKFGYPAKSVYNFRLAWQP